MHCKKHFLRILRQRYPVDFRQISKDIESRYQAISPDVAFARRSTNPMDRRLDFAAYFLATILVLESRGIGLEEIRHTCLAIAHEHVRPKSRIHAWFKRLPVRLIVSPVGKWLVGSMKKKTGQLGHPNGFRAAVLTDPAITLGLGYGVDILECGICKLFQKHEAHRFAAILCEVDKLTASLAGLEMQRTGTIAGGAARCDFRWRRMQE